ncbi:MAG: phosphorylase, partial [Pseudomonadota bacterium]
PSSSEDEGAVCWDLASPLAGIEGTSPARIYGSDVLIGDPAEKARIAARSAATAVDMESHRVARVAAEAGIPALAVRAISDPLDRALPVWMGGVIGPGGRPRMARVLMGFLRHPGDLPALLQAGRESAAALATLRGAAARLDLDGLAAG